VNYPSDTFVAGVRAAGLMAVGAKARSVAPKASAPVTRLSDHRYEGACTCAASQTQGAVIGEPLSHYH
jgi:hypothetical protein